MSSSVNSNLIKKLKAVSLTSEQINSIAAQIPATDISNKVDKETGKGLYPNTDAVKLLGIETGAEVNNISDVNATDLTDGGETSLHTHAGGAGITQHQIEGMI